jgi:hypothetical protein
MQQMMRSLGADRDGHKLMERRVRFLEQGSASGSPKIRNVMERGREKVMGRRRGDERVYSATADPDAAAQWHSSAHP